MLRHDPDIMMVGEVRDQETAEIAIQVALTGHLVFSTLHTNDAASGITRLLDMNIKSFLISSSVICFIAQRLVRMICPNCRQPVKPTVDLIKEFGIAEEELKKATFFAGRGCNMCQETGYHGRKGIYEFLFLDEELRSLIYQNVSVDQIRAKALEKGMKSLRSDGLEKVLLGLTTPEEVIRVTQDKLT
jgi:general secretion pathway protein E